MTFTFGKYKGEPVEKIMKINPSYCLWAHKNVVRFNLTEKQVQQCQKNLESLQGKDNTIYW